MYSSFAAASAALLLATALPASAQSRPAARPARANYEVRGQLTHAPAGTRVRLRDEQRGGAVALDSAVTDGSGRFVLRGTLAAPGVYTLRVPGQRETLSLALAPGSHLRVQADAAQLWRSGQVTGSAEAAALSAMNQEQVRLLGQIDALAQRRAQTTDTATLRQIGKEWDGLFADLAASAMRVARQSSYVAPYVAATALSGPLGDEAFLDSATTGYARQWPASPHTQQLLRYRAMRQATAVGQVAPDIRLPGPDGKVVALSSLRGKYVLLDFWASWCGPCREDNGQLVQLYRRFRPKGFEAYSVSVDEKKQAWTDAIRQDGLPWAQVLDNRGEQSVAGSRYNVFAYPTTFLLDPQGRIVAKNLRGAALEHKLAELLP